MIHKWVVFIHLIGFVVAGLLVITFTLGQLIVYPDFTRLLRNWSLSDPQKVLAIISELKKENEKRLGENILLERNGELVYKNMFGSKSILAKEGLKLVDWVVDTARNKVAVILIDKMVIIRIYNLTNGERELQIELAGQGGNLIQWTNHNVLYVAVRQNISEWTIQAIDASGKIAVVKSNINYPEATLVKQFYPIDRLIVYPNCPDLCHIEKLNINDPDIISRIEVGSEYLAQGINFLHYDSRHDRLIYKTKTDGEMLLAFDENGYLWHKVHLFEQTMKEIKILGFKLTDQKLDLIAVSQGRNEIYFYDLLGVNLDILEINNNNLAAAQWLYTDSQLIIDSGFNSRAVGW